MGSAAVSVPVPVVVDAAMSRPIDALRSLLGVDAPTDPASVHRARTSTRRLRSNLRALSRVLQVPEAIRDDLAWVGGSLGVVRDADVLADRVRTRVGSAPEAVASGSRMLIASVDAYRRAANERLRSDLASVRFGGLIRELDVIAKEGSSSEDTIEASSVMRRRWRGLRDVADSAGRDGSDERLHELRIQAKRARYAAELFEQAGGARCRRFIRRATAIQDVLGAQHDASRAAGWLVELDVAGAAGARAAGWFAAEAAAEREALREAWGPAWQALDRRKARFW